MAVSHLDCAAGKGLTLLYVEDEQDDVLLLKLAFQRAGVDAKVQWVKSVQEAIDYLDGREKYTDRRLFPMPNAILLDLNLPGIGGFEFLHWFATSLHAGIPVIVCSSSLDPREHERARAEGALISLTKPCGLEELTSIASRVRDCCAAGSAHHQTAASP